MGLVVTMMTAKMTMLGVIPRRASAWTSGIKKYQNKHATWKKGPLGCITTLIRTTISNLQIYLSHGL